MNIDKLTRMQKFVSIFFLLQGILQRLVIVEAFPIFLTTKSILSDLKAHVSNMPESLISCLIRPGASWFLYT